MNRFEVEKPAVYRPRTLSNPNTGQTKTVRNIADEGAARSDGFTVDVSGPGTGSVTAGPEILARKAVILLIGPRNQPFPTNVMLPVGVKNAAPKKQSAFVNHHDTVVDLLKFGQQPTDGSMVVLQPGTLKAYAMDAQPYDDIENGDIVEIVPNRPDQIGPFLTDTQRVTAEAAAVAVQQPVVAPASGYPKVLGDPESNRPEVTVGNREEEESARANGFTVEKSTQNPEPQIVS